MRRGVCSPRGRARYTAPTPPFSSAWQIVRGMDSAFKTQPTSPPRHPFGGVSSKGYFPQSSSASRLTAGALGFLTFTQCAEGPGQRKSALSRARTLPSNSAGRRANIISCPNWRPISLAEGSQSSPRLAAMLPPSRPRRQRPQYRSCSSSAVIRSGSALFSALTGRAATSRE
jgi:hypothetical protein